MLYFKLKGKMTGSNWGDPSEELAFTKSGKPPL